MTGAIKFTKQGYIKMGFQIVPQGVRLYAGDTGCGMTENEVNRVFNRFEKFNMFEEGTAQGTTIAKAIVEIYHGEIGAVSSPGKGSTFWAILPLNTGTDDHAADDGAGHGRENVSGQKVSDRDCATVRILVAEDNDSNYRLFETILRRDYRLLHAWNGEQAVELCRKEHPHVILMDINMPVMNGYEAAAEIRKFAADIPIVAVTAYAYASDEQKIMQNGFTGYMPKPINAPQLKKQILDILRKRITLI